MKYASFFIAACFLTSVPGRAFAETKELNLNQFTDSSTVLILHKTYLELMQTINKRVGNTCSLSIPSLVSDWNEELGPENLSFEIRWYRDMDDEGLLGKVTANFEHVTDVSPRLCGIQFVPAKGSCLKDSSKIHLKTNECN